MFAKFILSSQGMEKWSDMSLPGTFMKDREPAKFKGNILVSSPAPHPVPASCHSSGASVTQFYCQNI